MAPRPPSNVVNNILMQSQINSKNYNSNVPKLPNASKDPRNRKYRDSVTTNKNETNTKMPVINSK